MTKKEQKLAIIMPGTQKDLFTGALIVLKESLLKNFPNFDVNKNCFVILNNNNDLSKLDLEDYNKIVVVDPNNKLIKIEEFIVKNCYRKVAQKFSWFLGKSTKIPTMKKFFGENSVHICNEHYFHSKSMPLGDYEMVLMGAIYTLTFGIVDSCPRTKRVAEAINIAKFKDKEVASGPIFLEKTIKQLFLELITKSESPLIADLISEFRLLKEAERKAKRTKIEHPTLGLLKVVKPKKGSITQNKSFFEKGFQLGYSAVAVRSANNSQEYELCLKNNLAKKIADEIPAIKRINGCRFIVSKEFLIQEPEIK
ncbi:hypothetical protein GW758_04450 [Candidatus Falkowbacteria bacterium]|nr:hypothetical protein [Candidatus Falkowbacteria bacterium]NCT55172.1 hypothetical protein [Candidatus Falkowbacteria bacterium]